MTTILACDVLPDMVIRTMFEPDYRAGLVASATFRVASVDSWDGTVRIHADSPSSQIFEIPDYVQVQVLQWPLYAHEAVVTDPEVVESCREDPDLEAGNKALRKAKDDVTRVLRCVEVNAYIRDVAEGVIPVDEQVEAAVERVLRRQQSKGQHPSNGGK